MKFKNKVLLMILIVLLLGCFIFNLSAIAIENEYEKIDMETDDDPLRPIMESKVMTMSAGVTDISTAKTKYETGNAVIGIDVSSF